MRAFVKRAKQDMNNAESMIKTVIWKTHRESTKLVYFTEVTQLIYICSLRAENLKT